LPLPPNLDPAVAAPLGCSGATAYRSVVALGQADEDDLVIVIGAGGVGLSAIQIARVQGARVLAVDPREEARKAALDSGAQAAVPPQEAEAAARDLAADTGVDLVIDLVGTRTTFNLGRSLLGFGGRFVAMAPGTESVSITADDLVDGGKAYLGSYSSTMADLARVIALVEAGRLRPIVRHQVDDVADRDAREQLVQFDEDRRTLRPDFEHLMIRERRETADPQRTDLLLEPTAIRRQAEERGPIGLEIGRSQPRDPT